MKALIKLALLAVLAGGGYFGYKTLDNSKYGIAGDTPLGSFAILDTYLIEELGLTKSTPSTLPVRDVEPTARMFRYTNPENPYESVTLFLDAADVLRGMLGVYWLGDYGSRSPVMLVSQAHWRRMGGARKPDFTETPEQGVTISEAVFVEDDVAGRWKEWDEQGQRQVAIHLQVR